MRTLALQLYTVRHALERNPEETLRLVREAGYHAVETAPLPPHLTTRRLAGLLREVGLTVTAAHGDLPLGDRQNEVLDDAAEFGTSRIIWHGWPRDPACDSLDGFRRLADRYAAAFEASERYGLHFGLHNHWWEFEKVDGIFPYQLLHDLLPTGVFFELDVYWVQTASVSPLQILAELSSRIRMLHLKDGPARHGEPMTALGEGNLDIAAIARTTAPSIDWVVELDECATDPLDAARRSLQFLQRVSPPVSA